jgi:hypothetical protein
MSSVSEYDSILHAFSFKRLVKAHKATIKQKQIIDFVHRANNWMRGGEQGNEPEIEFKKHLCIVPA